MRIVALGLNKKSEMCCIIKSKATFDMLKDNFDLYNISYAQTNWNGCDSLSRTLEKLKERGNYELTGNSFEHNGTNKGYDYDCGHEYSYAFKFDTVLEIIEK